MEPVWIVVSDGTPQCMYVGKVTTNAERKLELDGDGFLKLEECRVLRSLMVPTPTGIGLDVIVTPIGVCKKPITIRVRPVMYYWPDEDPEGMHLLERHMQACEFHEAVNRAKAVGIEVASEIPKETKM